MGQVAHINHLLTALPNLWCIWSTFWLHQQNLPTLAGFTSIATNTTWLTLTAQVVTNTNWSKQLDCHSAVTNTTWMTLGCDQHNCNWTLSCDQHNLIQSCDQHNLTDLDRAVTNTTWLTLIKLWPTQLGWHTLGCHQHNLTQRCDQHNLTEIDWAVTNATWLTLGCNLHNLINME